MPRTARVGSEDSFERNAQSFRIVARQSVRTFHYTGLNLTRATLNAILKYPWFRGEGADDKRDRKWGAYRDEKELFDFARGESPAPYTRSAEAEIMDWADDIAYALHDTEDFYRAGLIPLDRLIPGRDQERDAFLSHYFAEKKITDAIAKKQAAADLTNAIGNLGPQDRFIGSIGQRSTLRSWVSNRIVRYVKAFSIRATEGAVPTSHILPDAQREIDLLKQLTWYYVIKNPALASQQAGQRKIIRDLFAEFRKAATDQRDENLSNRVRRPPPADPAREERRY